jgi:transposase
MSRFIQVDRQTNYLLPPSVDEWLPADHLARFVVEVVEQLDLSELTGQYTGRGSKAHHPEVLLGLLVYGYATGVFSSRKIERATYDSVAFRYVAANTHPDHDTLAGFRRRFLPQIEELFVQVLLLAREMKLLKLGTIALDGTKIKANASRHRALSYGYAQRLEAQLSVEVKALTARAEAADRQASGDGMDLPEEIARREQRLAAIAEAKAKIEARARERFEVEQAAYEAKRAKREAQRQAGQKPRGKEPKPPAGGPGEKDQVNLTDDESRIMPVAGQGFDQCYNAQASVDTETLLVTHAHLSAAANDKQQLAPALAALQSYPELLGKPSHLLADTGYFSAANVAICRAHCIEPLLAIKREPHHRPVFERVAADTPAPQTDNPVEQMAHRLTTQAGRALYALRKHTIEPVFGIIKHVMGFRQFSLRGLEKTQGEWSLVTMAWNIKRMHGLMTA